MTLGGFWSTTEMLFLLACFALLLGTSGLKTTFPFETRQQKRQVFLIWDQEVCMLVMSGVNETVKSQHSCILPYLATLQQVYFY